MGAYSSVRDAVGSIYVTWDGPFLLLRPIGHLRCAEYCVLCAELYMRSTFSRQEDLAEK